MMQTLHKEAAAILAILVLVKLTKIVNIVLIIKQIASLTQLYRTGSALQTSNSAQEEVKLN